MDLIIEQDFAARVPGYRALIFEADVMNSETSDEQKAVMEDLAAEIAGRYDDRFQFFRT